MKSDIDSFAISWKDVKIMTLSNCWKKLLVGENVEPQDFNYTLICAGKNNVTMQVIKDWLEENEVNPNYQILSTEEIADSVRF